MGMEVDRLEEEDAFKFDEEDPRPEDRSAVKKKVSKQDEKTKVMKAGEPME